MRALRPSTALLRAWSAAATLAAPGLRLMLAARARRGKEVAARLPERRGIDPVARPPGRLIWLHAASVGEAMSLLPVLQELATRAPGVHLLLTTGTVTSAALVATRLPATARHRFVPLDVPRWAARFLDHWRPDAVCLVESEIWPNLLQAAARRAIPLALLNARLSARSFARWRRAPGTARAVFGGFALAWARSAEDAARLRCLAGGPMAGSFAAPGDLKFAAPPLPADPAALAGLQAACSGRPVWVAASLHHGEDAAVIAAHHRLARRWAGLITILVPRHPQRAAAMVAAQPMPRRSLGAPVPAAGLYLADTLGELGLFYRVASCAFVGGSLVPHGGQNPLEPAKLGLPVAMGPHAGNFREACARLVAAGALVTVTDATSLSDWVEAMLADPAARRRVGVAGQHAASAWTDLPGRAAQALLDLLPAAG